MVPRQLCLLASLLSSANCLVRVPFSLPDTARFQVQESFVWFRAKNRQRNRLLWRETHIVLQPDIGLVGRVFANGPGDLGSISGHVIPKTLKMVLDTSLLNTQQYMVLPRVKE